MLQIASLFMDYQNEQPVENIFQKHITTPRIIPKLDPTTITNKKACPWE